MRETEALMSYIPQPPADWLTGPVAIAGAGRPNTYRAANRFGVTLHNAAATQRGMTP